MLAQHARLPRRLGTTRAGHDGRRRSSSGKRLCQFGFARRTQSRLPEHRRSFWPRQELANVRILSSWQRRLVDLADVSILVLCGPDERESAREIVRATDHPHVVSLADQSLSIGLSKACVRRSALLITTDSGPRHFAAAFGTPVITLFGPTHIAWTRTYHPHAWHILHKVPCGPCQRPVCPEGHHRCMRDLTPESVLRAALRSLAATETTVSGDQITAE